MDDLGTFYDLRTEVDGLKTKLRHIKETVATMLNEQGFVQNSLVPVGTRESLVNIYDEHGGLELLSDYTKIGFNTIKHWHVKWRANPACFRKEYVKRAPKGAIAASAVKRALKGTVPRPTKKHKIITETSRPREILFAALDAEAQQEVESVSAAIQRGVLQGPELDECVCARISVLLSQLGDHKQVAILLGVSESLISKWVSQ